MVDERDNLLICVQVCVSCVPFQKGSKRLNPYCGWKWAFFQVSKWEREDFQWFVQENKRVEWLFPTWTLMKSPFHPFKFKNFVFAFIIHFHYRKLLQGRVKRTFKNNIYSINDEILDNCEQIIHHQDCKCH